MKKNGIFLMILTLLVMLAAAVSVSAQDIDLSNLNNEQLLDLVQTIMQKLEEPEEEIPSPEPTELPTPTPAPQTILDVDQVSDPAQLNSLMQMILKKLNPGDNGETAAETPETEPTEEEQTVSSFPEIKPDVIAEAAQYQIYDNKKLIIERVPDDRFIQKPSEKDKSNPEKKDKGKEHYNGEPCTSDGATWWFFDGKWTCGYG